MCEPEFKPRADEPIIEICVNLRQYGHHPCEEAGYLKNIELRQLVFPIQRRVEWALIQRPASGCIRRTTSTKMDAKPAAARLMAWFPEHGTLLLAWFPGNVPLLPRFEWGLLRTGWLHGENFPFQNKAVGRFFRSNTVIFVHVVYYPHY